jgi:hypothetical protein
MNSDTPYKLNGNSISDQAEASSANPAGGNVQMRILVELQVIAFLLHSAYDSSTDLADMRQDISDSIT